MMARRMTAPKSRGRAMLPENMRVMLTALAVIYTIVHIERSQPIRRETCRGRLNTAKDMAIAAVEKGIAERAEVRDVNGKLVFHYPRAFPT